MNETVSLPTQQTSLLSQIRQRRALQRSQRAKREGFYSPPTNPNRIKTTLYLTPTTRDILRELMRSLGYSTTSSAVDGLLLSLGRELRLIPGVGPRGLRGFASFVGLDDTLPPEYRQTAREREHQRAQRARSAGFSHKSPEQIRLEIEEYEQEKAEFFRGELSLALAEEVELLDVHQRTEEEAAEFFRGELSLALAEEVELNIEPDAPRFEFILKAPTVEELRAKSGVLAALVADALKYCAKSLEFACREAVGDTLEALEHKIKMLVELNKPAPPNHGKRRLNRNLS